MKCPCCKSNNVFSKYNIIVLHEDGQPYCCSDCNFSFLAFQDKMVHPLQSNNFLCPLCKKAEPRIVNIPVLTPRVGLECTKCKKILCIWEGHAPDQDALPLSFQPNDWVPEFQDYEDPLKETVQSALVAVFLDSISDRLSPTVEIISAAIEKSGLLSKIKRNRIIRKRKETKNLLAHPKPKKKRDRKNPVSLKKGERKEKKADKSISNLSEKSKKT